MATDFRLKESLPELTDRVVSTYFELGAINHLGHCPLPNHEAVISATDRTLLRSSYCPHGCGFDRSSEGDTRFLRIEGDEAVIFESFNPGAIVRVWMTMGFGTSAPLNENVRLRLYLDDLSTPAIDVSLPDFFDGADPRWPLPMADNREASAQRNRKNSQNEEHPKLPIVQPGHGWSP